MADSVASKRLFEFQSASAETLQARVPDQSVSGV